MTPVLRDLVRAQSGRCRYCGHPFGKGKRQPTVDHMHPIWDDGADVPANRCAACHECNELKGPLYEADFLKHRHDLVFLAQLRAQVEQVARGAAKWRRQAANAWRQAQVAE